LVNGCIDTLKHWYQARLKSIHIGILVYWSQFVLIAGPLGQLVYWDIGRSAGYGPERFSGGMNDRFSQLSQRAGAESICVIIMPQNAIG